MPSLGVRSPCYQPYFSIFIFLCQNGNNFKLVLTQKRPQTFVHLVLIRSTATKTKAKWSLDLNVFKTTSLFLIFAFLLLFDLNGKHKVQQFCTFIWVCLLYNSAFGNLLFDGQFKSH